MNIEISPAYGRDYRSKKATLEDFNANRDFKVESINSPYCGKYCNRRDLERLGVKTVEIRYSDSQGLTPPQSCR